MKKLIVPAFAMLAVLAGCTTFQGDDTTVNIDTATPDVAQEDRNEPDDLGGVDANRQDGVSHDQVGELDDNDEGGTDANVDHDEIQPDTVVPDQVEPVDAAADTLEPRGRLSVVPYVIDFGYIPLGGEATVPFTVKNIGDAPLRVDKFVTTGPASVVLDVGFEGQASGMKTTYVISPPKVLKVNASFDGKVVFKPTEAVEVYTELKVFSSDTDYPDGYVVHVMGNKTRPALEVTPGSIDFGAVVIGNPITQIIKLKSVGGMNVKINGVYPTAGASEMGFRVEFPTTEPTVQNPVTLAPMQTLDVNIVYDPARISPVDSLGRPQTEEGQIVISGDMFTGTAYERVTGVAVAGACTKPIVEFLNEYNTDGYACSWDESHDERPAEDRNTKICKTADGWEVPTGTLVRLSGAQSFSPFGDITEWTWTATQPARNLGIFVPSASEVEPMFMVGAAPEVTDTPYYEIFLNVMDSLGYTNCDQSSVKITVRPEVKADILLTWTPVNPFTPTPPHMGQDVDLHFTHMNAGSEGTEPDIDGDGTPDNWFDLPWDCFWFNPEPAKDLWGQASPWVNDLVRLRNDSDDGQEPEVLTMGLECPNGRGYKVGAHFFDDYDYGPADVTVQIFAKGQLLYSATERLSSLDMWYVGDLKCKTVGLDKTAEFIPNTTKPVAHDYVNTDFGNP